MLLPIVALGRAQASPDVLRDSIVYISSNSDIWDQGHGLLLAALILIDGQFSFVMAAFLKRPHSAELDLADLYQPW